MKASSKFIKTPKQRQAIDVIAKHKYCLLSGGSRAGKTIIILFVIVIRALYCRSRHAVLRFHFNDVKTSIGMDTLPYLLDLLKIPYDLNKTDWVFTFQNGSEIWLGGLDDKERVEKILGKEYSTIYINEASQVSYHAYTSARTRLAEVSGLENKLLIDCNPPEKTHWLYSVFKLHEEPITRAPLIRRSLYGYIDVNPIDNISNLPEGYIDETLSGMDERSIARFRDGVWLDKRKGALWDIETIGKTRVTCAPQLGHIYVGVDPAVSANEDSDETGIVVVGKGLNNHLYVLADFSVHGRAEVWGDKVCLAYHTHKANLVVGEKNNGGDLVEVNVHTHDPLVNYEGVWAMRNKQIRADPISGLYRREMIHHVGYFPELEEQMTGWVPGEKSPDRMDALVWACTKLLEISPYTAQPNVSCVSATTDAKYSSANRTSAAPARLSRPPSFGAGRRR